MYADGGRLQHEKIILLAFFAICTLCYFPNITEAGETSHSFSLPEYCNPIIGNTVHTTLYTKTTNDLYSNVELLQSQKIAVYTRIYYFDWDAAAILPANPETVSKKGEITYHGYYMNLSNTIEDGSFLRLDVWNYVTGTDVAILRWDYR